jgi:hypothetical protein
LSNLKRLIACPAHRVRAGHWRPTSLGVHGIKRYASMQSFFRAGPSEHDAATLIQVTAGHVKPPSLARRIKLGCSLAKGFHPTLA